jgi:hypothetical protein
MQGDQRRRRILLGFAIGIPVSLVFLWLAARGTDREAVRDALAGVRGLPLLGGVLCLGTMYLLQSVRWRMIVGEPALRVRAFLGWVVMGVAVNNVLPGRIGDILRARWLSVDGRMPWGRALATVVFDRAGDVIALALLLAASVWTIDDAPWLRRVAVGTALGVVAIVVAVVLARVYAGRRERGRRQRGRVRTFVRDTVDGLARPLGPRLVTLALLLSLAAWGMFALAVSLVARSVGFELTPLDAVFVAAVVNLGVAIPSSPGFVGTYQWLAVESLARLDVATREEALAFSILLHAAWYVPTTLVGGGLIVRRALRGAVRAPATPTSSADGGG